MLGLGGIHRNLLLQLIQLTLGDLDASSTFRSSGFVGSLRLLQSQVRCLFAPALHGRSHFLLLLRVLRPGLRRRQPCFVYPACVALHLGPQRKQFRAHDTNSSGTLDKNDLREISLDSQKRATEVLKHLNNPLQEPAQQQRETDTERDTEMAPVDSGDSSAGDI